MLEGARSNITQAKELLKRLLDPSSPDAIKIDPDDPSTLDNRKQLQEAYTRVTVQLPNVIEKLADTYPDGDGIGILGQQFLGCVESLINQLEVAQFDHT